MFARWAIFAVLRSWDWCVVAVDSTQRVHLCVDSPDGLLEVQVSCSSVTRTQPKNIYEDYCYQDGIAGTRSCCEDSQGLQKGVEKLAHCTACLVPALTL